MTREVKKPYDLGDGFSCASYLEGGQWLALVRPHATHGMIELTGAAEFDETSRGDQDVVRQYRRSLTTVESAFLTPRVSGRVDVVDRGIGDDGSIWLRMRIEGFTSGETPLSFTLDFRGWLQRPPYAEITDIAPLPPLSRETALQAQDDRLELSSRILESTAEIVIEVDQTVTSRWVIDGNNAAHWEGIWQTVDHGPSYRDVVVRCRLTTPSDPPYSLGDAALGWAAEANGPEGLCRIVEGARSYILECCALRVSEEESVFITDHRLLPLSWTRDAYYMALLLLLSGGDGVAPVIGRHLRWLWGTARQNGAWMRSHLTNGTVKDPGLQADQQVYPILELLDYRRAVGSWPESPTSGLGWGELVQGMLDVLPADPITGLLVSEENPADEVSEFRFCFSTQILYFHVLDELAEWGKELGLDVGVLADAADRLRCKVREVFSVDGSDGVLFAYESDGDGGHRLYGDANDLPTVLAPAWGFCDIDDPVWRRTMRFILSPANAGWSPGPYGGLGSIHTSGTWPLGDVQSYLFHTQIGEIDEAGRVAERLIEIAADDGLLPETYDSVTGEWSARHWFAWPAAALGCAVLAPTFMPGSGR